MSITIRKASQHDLAQIIRLHAESRRRLARFRPAGLDGDICREVPEQELTDYFGEMIQDTQCWLAVAELDGRFAGFLSAALQDYPDVLLHSPYMTIEFVEVLPDLNGRGVATALMQAAEQFARQNGIRNIDLLVWQDNPRAQALYGRLGYAPLELRMFKLLDARGD